jgi:transposase InsO family protein
MDSMGPLPETVDHHQHALAIVDHFTRFVVAVRTQDQKAESVLKVLRDHWITLFGPPTKLLSDNGANFKSSLLNETTQKLRIHRVFTTPYQPQCDGGCERLAYRAFGRG